MKKGKKTTRIIDKINEQFAELMKQLPATETAYKRKWHKEQGNPLLMLKGSSADKEDSLRNYNEKRFERSLVYDFSRYEFKEPIDREAIKKHLI